MPTVSDDSIEKGQSTLREDLEWMKGNRREVYRRLLSSQVKDPELLDIIIDNADKMSHRFYTTVVIQGFVEDEINPGELRRFDVSNMTPERIVTILDEICDAGTDIDESPRFWDQILEAFGHNRISSRRTKDPRKAKISNVTLKVHFTKGEK